MEYFTNIRKEIFNKIEDLNKKIKEYNDTLNKLRMNEVQMQEQINAAQNQISILNRTLASENTLLRETQDELYSENKRAEEIKEQITTLEEELAEIEAKRREFF